MHIPHSIPFRAIAYVYKKVKDWMFFEPLKASHGEWQKRHRLGTTWQRIGEGIEFSDALARWPEGPEVSRIAFRSVGNKYDEITIVIEVEYGENLYDETRIVSWVDGNPRIVTLSAIPAYTDIYLQGYELRVSVTSLTTEGVTRRVNLQSHSS